MNYHKIKRLIGIVEESDISSLEISWIWGRRVFIQKRSSCGCNVQPVPDKGPIKTIEEVAKPKLDGPKYDYVVAPNVGTFYWNEDKMRGPKLKKRDEIEEGHIVGYYEALNIMHEIVSPYNGKITHVYINDGKPIESGQNLFRIRLKA